VADALSRRRSGSPLSATYRLQMNKGFTLRDAHARLDYYARLGISHLYLSPILAARRGSMHGYDVVDPKRVNPELGTRDDLDALAGALHERGMGLIVDIVPNHMAIGPENPYWTDVLTHGERSPFASWFDIDWPSGGGGPRRQVVLPVLDDPLDRALERGELEIQIADDGDLWLAYHMHRFPIDPASLPPELQLTTIDAEETGELVTLYSGTAGRDRLRALLDLQHYRLVSWRRDLRAINYRRFFDVNDLVGVRVEDEPVFRETHSLTLQLVRDGIIDGVRVDHIDGLADPRAYLERLRSAVGADVPIFVEKILSFGETLPRDWPVQGTTGYEFLNELEDVFVDPAGYQSIETTYRATRRLGGTTFRDIARAGKAAVLENALRADLDRVAILANIIATRAGKAWSTARFAEAIKAFVAALPVYRTYVDARGVMSDRAREVIDRAARAAREQAEPEIVDYVAALLRGETGEDPLRPQFVQRLQQLSGPAAAKGVEDTALYRYVPLLSRNEVGGAPDEPLSDAVERFHGASAERRCRWPSSLVCTNTHDTKRSADVRARLDVLSEVPRDWQRVVRRWRRLNAKHRRTVRGRIAPDPNTEYLFYQTLIAIWPAQRMGRRVDDLPDRAWRDAARERLVRYMLKAAREAKLRTSWTDPDSAYEAALTAFVRETLEPSEDAPFLFDVARLVARIAATGFANSLARVVIHLTAPGTPDLYQGDELWNFTLVDPDNRGQVDYDARVAALDRLDETGRRLSSGSPIDLTDNGLKLLVTHRLLDARRANAGLFIAGQYEPLSLRGARAGHVIAFARIDGPKAIVTIAPRLAAELEADVRAGKVWWGDTTIRFPEGLQARAWHSPITGQGFPGMAEMPVADLLRPLPIAVLMS
jgi:(1->4)-alpha-D-glucan 1-alpha-D-glucosylmutase